MLHIRCTGEWSDHASCASFCMSTSRHTISQSSIAAAGPHSMSVHMPCHARHCLPPYHDLLTPYPRPSHKPLSSHSGTASHDVPETTPHNVLPGQQSSAFTPKYTRMADTNIPKSAAATHTAAIVLQVTAKACQGAVTTYTAVMVHAVVLLLQVTQQAW